MPIYRAIGLMSGSSLDGLDVAYCRFTETDGKWQFQLLCSGVVPYPEDWTARLRKATEASGSELWAMHTQLGNYFGEVVNSFVAQHRLTGQVDFVASHGHTVFHFPERKYTTQIGDGAALAVRSGLPVVCDFRSADVAAGGQGAPIVPIGDALLFPDYPLCLNIGGISNVSCKTDRGIIAFDICPANQLLNFFAAELGKEYDKGGAIAAIGKPCVPLLRELDTIAFYAKEYPKSLDNSFSRTVVLPYFDRYALTSQDKLATCTEHIARQTARQLKAIAVKESIQFTPVSKMLLTGGGAFNTFLVQRIGELVGVQTVVPDDELVAFKEALVIALMGALRMNSTINIWSAVTGATKDSVGGAVYLP